MLSSWALSRIQSEIAEFRKTQRRDFYTPDHALAKKLEVPSSDEMYICCDCSVRNNGSCGYIITNRGIYTKAWMSIVTHFISFEKLARVSDIEPGRYIEADGELIAYADDVGWFELTDLIESIRDIARQDLGI